MTHFDKLESRSSKLMGLIDKVESGAVKRRLTKEYKRVSRRLRPHKAAQAAAAANAAAAESSDAS